MLILQFFGRVCGFLVGFNRRPSDARACGFGFPETPSGVPGYYKSASFRRPALVGDLPAHLWCTGLLGIGVLQTPLAGWVGFPETPAVYRVARHRLPPDALGRMGWLSGDACGVSGY